MKPTAMFRHTCLAAVIAVFTAMPLAALEVVTEQDLRGDPEGATRAGRG